MMDEMASPAPTHVDPEQPRRGKLATAASDLIVAVTTIVLAGLTWGAWFVLATAIARGAEGALRSASEPWQWIGAAVTLVVLTIVSSRWTSAPVAVVSVTAGFTLGFSIAASAVDDSGLWAVGALMVAGGTLVAMAVVTVIDRAIRLLPPN
ncbi:hypothetical protein [Marisediminicola sp. LYQ134]|uniref:hypothetical protein n=1 Tax=Marisediminicola sp. LYQ134 TaxID=3391061 RepID=UPI0039836C3C